MKIGIEVEGNKTLVKGLKDAVQSMLEFVEEEIHDTTQEIASKAVSRAPVDLGILRNSNYVKLGKMSGETGFTVKYAPYVEFGTGGKVNIPAGLEEYASQYKGAGVRQVNLPARPFLFNSAFEEQVELTNKLNKDFDSASLTVRLL